MGPDGWIDSYLSRSPHPAFIEIIGSFLNKLGKGDAIAFLCILLAIAGYFAARSKWVKSAGGGILILLTVGPVVQTLKHLLGRARPQMNLGDLHIIGPNLIKNGFDSMPSGHAMASFAVATFFSFLYPRLKIPLVFLALSISLFGRVFFRHHYLSDVIVGGAIGIGLGLFFYKKLKSWIAGPEQEEKTKTGASFQNSSLIVPDEAADSSTSMRYLLTITVFSSIILVTGLGSSALWDRDETEYAQAAIEMQEKDEWLIPTLEGEPFIEKPILLYWFVRMSYLVGGVNEFSTRFPCALFGVFSCIAAFYLGKLLWGNKVGLFSALILSSSFLFVGGFKLLLTDSFLVLFVLLSLFFYAYSFKKPERHKGFTALSYVFMGLAVLSKGPVAFFPVIVFLIYERLTQDKNWVRFFLENCLSHALFSTIALLIAAPWFLYSFSVQKEATSTFFLYDNLFRFLKGSEGHTGPVVYYIPVLLLGLFPWSFFLVPAVKREWQKRTAQNAPMENGTLLLSLWAMFLFVFFSLSAHKLPHYMLPVLPVCSCLIAKFWHEQNSEKKIAPRLWWILTSGISLLLLLLPTALYFVRPEYASFRLIFPFLLFACSIGLAFLFSSKGQWEKSLTTLSLGALALFLTFSLGALPWIDRHRVMKPIGLAIKKHASPDNKLIGYHLSEPSLFIYGGKVFPKIEHQPLDPLLRSDAPTYIVLTENRLKQSEVTVPYDILEKKAGFAENGGEMTVLLIRNKNK